MSDDLVGTKFKLRGKTWVVSMIFGQYAYIDSGKNKSAISLGLLRRHLSGT